MVIIYIWKPEDGSVGHGSMTLSNGTHISWWPAGEKSKRTIKRNPISSVDSVAVSSYDEDEELEGRRYDYCYQINGLDEDAIASWWNDIKDRKKYHLLTNNCCSVIYDALEKGGAKKIRSFPTGIAKPMNLKEYAEKLQKALQ